MSLLSVENITKIYQSGHKAVDNVSFHIDRGECIGLVGESGCGKSTLARCLMRIENINEGSIIFNGENLEKLNERALFPYRRKFQIVFQNPSAALNPKLKIKDSLLDPYLQYKGKLNLKAFSFSSKEHYIKQLLDSVELPEALSDRYPHELSGGQKQRVTIARAISIEPEFIILDEPTASLDVISQGAVLTLLKDLQKQLNLSYLFISHDLAAVNQMCQRILVMKQGQVVDHFHHEKLFDENRHAYTKELISIF